MCALHKGQAQEVAEILMRVRANRTRVLDAFNETLPPGYPFVNFKTDGAAEVLELLEEVLKASDSENPRK